MSNLHNIYFEIKKSVLSVIKTHFYLENKKIHSIFAPELLIVFLTLNQKSNTNENKPNRFFGNGMPHAL